jgi:hypothetical protein
MPQLLAPPHLMCYDTQAYQDTSTTRVFMLLHLPFSTKKTSMKILALAALIPMMAAPAMAGPYVESKTTAAGTLTDGGTYKGAQTEVRGGYQTKVGTSGLKVYAEVGPGYEWNNGGTNEGVVVSEVGLSYPLATNLSLKTKVAGEYGLDSESFDLGGEVKVRYSF